MSKNILKLFMALLIFSVTASSYLMSADSKVVRFKTNPHCESCVNKIETSYAKVEGVEESHVCLESKTVKLTYNPEKTNEAKLKQALLDMGYEAGTPSATDCCKVKNGEKTSCCGKGETGCGKTEGGKSCGSASKSCGTDKANGIKTSSAKTGCSVDAKNKTCGAKSADAK